MARSFNGTSDFIDVGNSSTLNPATMTISCWYNWDGTTNSDNIRCLVARDDVGARDYNLALSTNIGKPILQVSGSNIANFGSNISSQWVHLAVTGPGSDWLGYQNGSVTNLASTQAINIASTNNTIGKRFISGFEDFFSGSIADVAIWNIILTGAEISALAVGARPYTIRPASLVGYWPLGGLQSPEPDLSGNAFNGTLTGTTNASGPPIMQFTPRWPQFPFIAVAPPAFTLMPQIVT